MAHQHPDIFRSGWKDIIIAETSRDSRWSNTQRDKAIMLKWAVEECCVSASPIKLDYGEAWVLKVIFFVHYAKC